jgi:hypothetical protein
MHPPAQIAFGPFPNPAAVDVEHKLGAALDEDHPGITGAQPDHPGIRAMLDEIIDNSALQFERHYFEQGDTSGQRHQHYLM